MAKSVAVASLVEKAEEVSGQLDFELAGRLTNLLDLALDCQNQGIDIEPVLILKGFAPEKYVELRSRVAAYRREGRDVWLEIRDDESVILKF